MSRYKGPRLRIIRRLGKLPGLTNKVSNKVNPPGQHGISTGKKVSQFCIKLKEKQKLRFHYGINERQLLNYLKKARKKKGSSGLELLVLLEMRLDNIIFRLGLSSTILAARQLVTHGHILVDKNIINIPSFSCKPSSIISLKNSQFFKKNENFLSINNTIPSHLSLNLDKLEGKVVNFVNVKSLLLIINELLVVEYYSRKL
uniref:Small ribosomal subunit protein uS4c n=1 Tax=Phacus pleuronectes TaxID=102908 RepID=A0A3G3LLU7_9EUGL|nr:ribosomal protein S4 [Phacus pleuronectes]AYQ93683.1 ribosomal protein S4 [Phacus pleuronectes]